MEHLNLPTLASTPHWRCGAPTCEVKHPSEELALRCSKRKNYEGRLRITTNFGADDPARRSALQDRVALERAVLFLRVEENYTYRKVASITGLSYHQMTKLIKSAKARE